jgi:hypothetical protein
MQAHSKDTQKRAVKKRAAEVRFCQEPHRISSGMAALPAGVSFCRKLAMLEKEWHGVVGPEFAKRSAPESCTLEENCAVLTIHAENAAVATAMGPFKNALPRMLRAYLQVESVKVVIKVGKVHKASAAKPPLPDYKRRAPVVVSEEALEEARKEARAAIEDPELAEAMARLKATIERLQSRN